MKSYKLGTVEDLFISKDDIKDRLNQSEIVVDEDGVFIDKFYGLDSIRSILITSVQSYDIAADNGVKLVYGQLGENILVDFPLSKLHPGDKIQIADTVLEITQKCTMCEHLSFLDVNLPKILENDRGIFAKAVQGGIITTEDTIYSVGNADG